MENWFTTTKIDKSTYIISESKHWEETHCYLVLGREKAALIDTGMGFADIKKAAEDLTDLPITVLTSHAHWDHIGGHKLFGKIAVHEAERPWLAEKYPYSLQEVKAALTSKPNPLPADFSWDNYSIYHQEPQIILHDSDVIALGGRTLTVLHTPGHSPGHCCFYDSQNQYLFAGDLLYKGCLYVLCPDDGPLQYLQSLQKIQDLQLKRIFTGHHSLEIDNSFLQQVTEAFLQLQQKDELKTGSGVFDFGDFQIRL